MLTPLSTNRLGRPAALAPAMSVSSRSPTTSGVRNVPRANASVSSVGCGLPATWGSLSVAARSAATIDAVPGQQAPLGRQGQVDVGRDPQRAAADGQRRFGEVRPAGLRRMALHHRDRVVGPLPDRFEADLPHFGGQRLGADDENR